MAARVRKRVAKKERETLVGSGTQFTQNQRTEARANIPSRKATSAPFHKYFLVLSSPSCSSTLLEKRPSKESVPWHRSVHVSQQVPDCLPIRVTSLFTNSAKAEHTLPVSVVLLSLNVHLGSAAQHLRLCN